MMLQQRKKMMTDETQEVTLGTNIEAEAPKKVGRPSKAARQQETVRILLEENEEIPPTGLFVGLNGRGYLIRAGEEVDVPVGVAEILAHAVMSTPSIDPSTKQVIGYRERMRYPYRTINR
jgi:hypothetical protein